MQLSKHFTLEEMTKFYRCSLCCEDLKQHVNGKISYIPTMHLNDKERNDLVSKNGQTEF